jgi:hypothetical protein
MSLLNQEHDEDAYPVPQHLVEPTDPAERTRLVAEARAQIEAGHFTPGDDVGDWLLELAAGRYAPPPCAR